MRREGNADLVGPKPSRRDAARLRRQRHEENLAREREGGQLMLLAAIVLTVGFIALSGMLSRVAQLSGETVREQEDPVLLEMDVVAGAIAMISNTTIKAEPGCTATTNETLVAAMAHLRFVESSRGFFMNYTTPTCTVVSGSQDEVSVDYRLTDGLTRVRLMVTTRVTHT